MIVNKGERIGRVNGLAVLGADSGLSDYSGVVLPVEAMVTAAHGRSGQVIATGGLSDLAKESVTNISAVVKKLTGNDIKDFDCLLYTSPSPRDMRRSRMPSSA